jgi:hypothetical protein
MGKNGQRAEADRRSNIQGSAPTPEWATGTGTENVATGTGTENVATGTGTENVATGTSIFDPVLCELVYRWFCPSGGKVLDPFAGGSVRGIVAAELGYDYTGLDLSERQVKANDEQAKEICKKALPRWIVADSRNVDIAAPGEYDLIFSCPPYGDLEQYSDDPRDLSLLEFAAFLSAYKGIVASCCGMLRANRFACFVVGDFRDKQGFYRNFVSETIGAFESAGARLYNEAILVTAVGSLPIRIGKQFGKYRKLGKTHQNVLVFYKGDPKEIPETLGECQFGDPGSPFGEDGEAAECHSN